MLLTERMENMTGAERAFSEMIVYLFKKTLEQVNQIVQEPIFIKLVRHARALKPQPIDYIRYDPSLDQEGVKQAQQVAQYLQDAELLLTSPSIRTMTTAFKVQESREFYLSCDPGKELRVIQKLQDSGFNRRWSSEECKILLTDPDSQTKFRQLFYNDLSWLLSFYSTTFGALLQQILTERNQGKTIAVITHGECIEAIIDLFNRQPIKDEKKIADRFCPYCSITTIELSRANGKLFVNMKEAENPLKAGND